jgi:ATP synthase protein I
MRDLDATRAKRILVAQAVTTLVLTLAGLLFGYRFGVSAFLGGGTATCANALFAWWVFGRYQASEPGKLLAQFYGGELLKLGFIVTVLVAVFVWVDPVSPLALLGVFLVVQVFPPLLANRIAG